VCAALFLREARRRHTSHIGGFSGLLGSVLSCSPRCFRDLLQDLRRLCDAGHGRDNLRNAAAKLGLGTRDVAAALSLFSPVAVDAQGTVRWQGSPSPGVMVQIRAEMNLLVALSNTPHALSPTQDASGTVSYAALPVPKAGPDDLCRSYTAEAARGFQNTNKVFAA
jgi:hypothetical protein